MYKLCLLTIAAMVAAGLMAGDPGTEVAADTPVTRGENTSFLYGFGGVSRSTAPDDGPSDAEAVRIAMAKGDELRAARDGTATPTRTLGKVLSKDGETALAVPEDAWKVSGTWVNLRSGPGTSHPVVTQAGLGDLLEPLSDTRADWIKVRLPDGGEAWIYGKYLQPRS